VILMLSEWREPYSLTAFINTPLLVLIVPHYVFPTVIEQSFHIIKPVVFFFAR